MQVTSRNPIKIIAGLTSFFTLVKDPANLDKVFQISRKVATPEILAHIANTLSSQSSHCHLALERRPRLDLSALKDSNLPSGTLGHEYKSFMAARGLDPAAIPSLPSGSREEYVLAHLYETHDLWHVICGFDTDVSGELGLQAFYCAQIPTPLSPILLSSGLLNTALFTLNEREARMTQIIRGWQMGTRGKPLFGVDWNKYWRYSVDEIRRDFLIAA